jgi:Tetratricopeptide repeat
MQRCQRWRTRADTAQSLDNLALVFREQGDLAAAQPLTERALAIREKVLGPDRLSLPGDPIARAARSGRPGQG